MIYHSGMLHRFCVVVFSAAFAVAIIALSQREARAPEQQQIHRSTRSPRFSITAADAAVVDPVVPRVSEVTAAMPESTSVPPAVSQAQASAHVLRRTNICTAHHLHRIYYIRNHHRYWKCR